MRKAIYTDQGAPPKGPYSQAIAASGPTLYISAQGPIDPQTGQSISGAFAEKAERVFENVSILLDAAGSTWSDVLKITIILNDMENFAELNAIYQRYVREPYPARTTLQSNIGANALFVDCIAALPEAVETR